MGAVARVRLTLPVLYVGRGRGRGEAWLQHGMADPSYFCLRAHTAEVELIAFIMTGSGG